MTILLEERARSRADSYEAARDLLVGVLEPGDTAIAQVRNNLGEFLRKHDRPQAAAVEFGAALRVMETGGLGEHPSAAQILVNLARIEMDTGDLDAACDKLERAVAIHRAGTGSAAARGEAQFVLAQCLVKRGGDKARVSALVNATLDDYGTIPAERSEPWRAQVESFMAKHRIKRQPPT